MDNAANQLKWTPEDENNLFLATGFRYLPASERGFPYPWCAKKSKKGWIIRDYPPAPMEQPDTGVEFRGWKVAEKMYRGRELLLQRVRNRVDQECGQSVANGTSESGRSGCDGALKRRNARKIDARYVIGRNAVSQWFRHTQQAVKTQRIQVREEEFQSFLRRKNKERVLQREQELQKKTQDEQKGTVDLHQLQKSASFNANEIPDASHLSISPLRRKHKKMIPKRNQQYRNSVILGEDPALDQMIEDIVREFTHECTHSKGNAGGVEFDGSAVSALREAAKDTLNAMTNRGHHVDNDQIVTKRTNYAAIADELFERENSKADRKTNMQIHHQKDGEEMTGNQIYHMIKELIGEIEQDSGCQFDGRALEALQEAAEEIASKDDGREFLNDSRKGTIPDKNW